jgi:hypothetical protein
VALMRAARLIDRTTGNLLEAFVNEDHMVPGEAIPAAEIYEKMLLNCDVHRAGEILAEMEGDLALIRRTLQHSGLDLNRDGLLAGYYGIRALRRRRFPDAPPIPRESFESLTTEQIDALASKAAYVHFEPEPHASLRGRWRVLVNRPGDGVGQSSVVIDASDAGAAETTASYLRDIIAAHMKRAAGR